MGNWGWIFQILEDIQKTSRRHSGRDPELPDLYCCNLRSLPDRSILSSGSSQCTAPLLEHTIHAVVGGVIKWPERGKYNIYLPLYEYVNGYLQTQASSFAGIWGECRLGKGIWQILILSRSMPKPSSLLPLNHMDPLMKHSLPTVKFPTQVWPLWFIGRNMEPQFLHQWLCTAQQQCVFCAIITE